MIYTFKLFFSLLRLDVLLWSAAEILNLVYYCETFVNWHYKLCYTHKKKKRRYTTDCICVECFQKNCYWSLPLVFKVDVLWKIGLNLDIFIYKGNSFTYYACSNQQKYAHLKKATSLMKTGLVKCLTDPVMLRWNVNGVKIEWFLLKNASYS